MYPNTRVLQLADNPEKQWFDPRQQTIDDVKQENKALLDRLTRPLVPHPPLNPTPLSNLPSSLNLGRNKNVCFALNRYFMRKRASSERLLLLS